MSQAALSSAVQKPWWDLDYHAEKRPFLLGRNKITHKIREDFALKDFVEVETAALSLSPGNETHLHAFATEMIQPDGERLMRYLHTSPEFACKKLLAAGEKRIFSLGKVWRNRERGPLHHPEFTMLEWYRTDEPYDRLLEDCQEILIAATEALGARDLTWKGVRIDPRQAPERLSVQEAFSRYAGLDLSESLSPDGATDRDCLAAQAAALGIRVTPDDHWSDIFSKLLVTYIEPKLGFERMTFLDAYPLSEAALARRKPDNPSVAERFELYVCGVELVNAFGELTDAEEQRRRFLQDMAEKHRLYGERYPLDEGFLDALSLMPQACGAALGLDRLVMLATGAQRIEQVLWAPVE